MELHASGEDYLEAVLVLQEKNGAVRSIDVAKYLGRSKPSVSRAIHLLQEGGFLTLDGKRQLCLTGRGRAVAEQVHERRCFFLQRLVALGIDPETAAADACRLEHAISAESFAKLKGAAGPL